MTANALYGIYAQRVGKALGLLKGGLGPFVERELKSA